MGGGLDLRETDADPPPTQEAVVIFICPLAATREAEPMFEPPRECDESRLSTANDTALADPSEGPRLFPDAAGAGSNASPSDDPPEKKENENLEDLLARIRNMNERVDKGESEAIVESKSQPTIKPNPAPGPPQKSEPGKPAGSEQPVAFYPVELNSFQETGLTDSQVEMLFCKYLFLRGDACGRNLADQVALPFRLIEPLLAQLKSDRVLGYKGAAPMNDYVYHLTEMGHERARRYSQSCTYYGAAPVSLEEYAESVRAQSLEHQTPTADDLQHAFSDLLINKKMLSRLGPAVNSGRGLFLYGSPGNGKTSIAERVTAAFGESIWIPRAIGIEGEIILVFDPNHHICDPEPESADDLLNSRRLDRRWVRVRRPTIVVGGELTMASLEVIMKSKTRTCEAPLQLKANCGTLFIDDFGRQRVSVDELLNRWIVPLEKRYDFLNLPNGTKVEVPFDELLVFATNFEPKDLVDEAFLRRIPYKIEVIDPTEEEFVKLFGIMCPKMGFEFNAESVQYLIEKHYHAVNRPFRCCQPRDLLLRIRNFCDYHEHKPELTPEYFDFAVENYFAIM